MAVWSLPLSRAMTWVAWPLSLPLVAGVTAVAVYVTLEGGKPSIQEMVTALLPGGKDCAGCHGVREGGGREEGWAERVEESFRFS